MIAYIFTLAKRFPSWTSLTRYFQSRKPVVLVLHLLVKIDYITALVQLLGRELHDLSNRNVNKPPVTEENSYRKITCPMGTATLPSKNIYIYIQPVGLNREFLLGRKMEAANTRGNHGWKNERGWKNGEQPAARFHCVYF